MTAKWTDYADAMLGAIFVGTGSGVLIDKALCLIPHVRDHFQLVAAASTIPALWLAQRWAQKSAWGNRAIREWEEAQPPGKAASAPYFRP